MTVTFLGTGAAIPTPTRNVSAALVVHGDTRILVDCGEGTGRQLLRYADAELVDVVFITHAHTDHLLGLAGLVRTATVQGAPPPRVHAPGAAAAQVKQVLDLVRDELSEQVLVHPLQPGERVTVRSLTISCFPTRHRGPSLGYVVESRDGGSVARVVFTGDTRPSGDTVRAAAGADLLVHEATFCEDERDRAAATGHSTAAEAATVAAEAGVKRLVLTHLSARYAEDPRAVEREAGARFPGAVVARDGLRIALGTGADVGVATPP